MITMTELLDDPAIHAVYNPVSAIVESTTRNTTLSLCPIAAEWTALRVDHESPRRR
jgi:hypothetical protein